eukprot:549040-Amphidinium_carterae.1
MVWLSSNEADSLKDAVNLAGTFEKAKGVLVRTHGGRLTYGLRFATEDAVSAQQQLGKATGTFYTLGGVPAAWTHEDVQACLLQTGWN